MTLTLLLSYKNGTLPSPSDLPPNARTLSQKEPQVGKMALPIFSRQRLQLSSLASPKRNRQTTLS